MGEYPGLPTAVSRFARDVVGIGIATGFAMGFLSLPAFLFGMLVFPDSLGYLLISFFAFLFVLAGRYNYVVHDEEEEVPANTIQETAEEQGFNRVEFIIFAISFSMVVSVGFGSLLVVSSVAALAVSTVNPLLGLLIAALIPVVDLNISIDTSIPSLTDLSTVLAAKTVVFALLLLSGIRLRSLEEMTEQGLLT